jgi:hypothetical protein
MQQLLNEVFGCHLEFKEKTKAKGVRLSIHMFEQELKDKMAPYDSLVILTV